MDSYDCTDFGGRDRVAGSEEKERREFGDEWRGRLIYEEELVNSALLPRHFYDSKGRAGRIPSCCEGYVNQIPEFDDITPASDLIVTCRCGKHRMEFKSYIHLQDSLGCGSDEARNGVIVRIWEKSQKEV